MLTHIVIARRQVDGLRYARRHGLPNPALPSGGERTVIVTRWSGSAGLRGLQAPIQVHNLTGAYLPPEVDHAIKVIEAQGPAE